ncbi:squalene epoxidase-domain-containing protein [Podospora didyma]|uniref:Squalene monooxygenase n=1 Tax=Podospora didyma TaxID=330526 RepID=A0AAE0NU94_9PEZI|nr:squalene epoxidase-domain-containing protein [Podospora didyma]
MDATPVDGYRLYWKDQEASSWFRDRQGRSPTGRSFYNGKLVTKLRKAAASQAHITLMEATVLEILRDAKSSHVTGVSCSMGNSPAEAFFAPLTILADGPKSNFRSQLTSRTPTSESRSWGLILTDAKLPVPRYTHAVLGHGPPILIYHIGIQETRILIDIPQKLYDEIGGSSAAVRAYLQERVTAVVPDCIRPQLLAAIRSNRRRSMSNTWMPATENTVPGIILLGDASNMRHPVAGGGMTVALKDVVLLSNMLDPARSKPWGYQGDCDEDARVPLEEKEIQRTAEHTRPATLLFVCP